VGPRTVVVAVALIANRLRRRHGFERVVHVPPKALLRTVSALLRALAVSSSHVCNAHSHSVSISDQGRVACWSCETLPQRVIQPYLAAVSASKVDRFLQCARHACIFTCCLNLFGREHWPKPAFKCCTCGSSGRKRFQLQMQTHVTSR
jgi:hypothetical protein